MATPATGLQKQWKEISAKINALSQRERVILLVMSGMALGGGWYQLFITPLEGKKKLVDQQVTQIEEEIAKLNALQAEVITLGTVDPNAAERRRLAKLKGELEEIDARLDAAAAGMVNPREMPELLRFLLTGAKGLRLVRIAALPVESLDDGKSPPPPPPPPKEGETTPAPAPVVTPPKPEDAIYRHAMEVTLRGNFNSVLAYLRAVEGAPHRVYWDSLEYHVKEYPEAEIRLRVYTLSFSQELVGT